ncbi:hypothetical protein [Brevundimonas sp.]|uniref:hypothetical protein n=1 Tax=Brevundimonas sp. TaxID=1871086 RepID=UPI002D3CF9E4|nr:hypothetical protein [Brevundimonas sp.]HYC73383.1 hypothetical protein [Brevundimonas sp.]
MTPQQTRALFSGLSAELGSMMETVEGLSSLVSEHARQAPADRRSGVLVKAQAIDDLHQTLDSIRRMAGALSGGVTIETALADIPLSALAARLQSAALSVAPGREGAIPSGDLVLFE